MLSQSVTEDIVLICAALQPIITALFWFFQCMGIQAKTLRLQAVRCLLFTLLHLGLYTGRHAVPGGSFSSRQRGQSCCAAIRRFAFLHARSPLEFLYG